MFDKVWIFQEIAMMKIEPFETHAPRYNDWFERNELVYGSELWAVREQLPDSSDALEVGVGSGRFATSLGIRYGLDPSATMARLATENGVKTVCGVAEMLPFADQCFDLVLMVTTVCFLDDVDAAFREAYRVLRPEGHLVVAFVDKDSPIGRVYQQKKDQSVFYREAIFYSTGTIIHHLRKCGFFDISCMQTLFDNLSDITRIESPCHGYGRGSFVVVRASKCEDDRSQKPAHCIIPCL
ncbi:MAG: class I SAM-dependent methyltransferase [Methanosarcinaceae archaeon]|nr:class I SAM-dependent methyltransferase [Methanosarcinaceae archaeon]